MDNGTIMIKELETPNLLVDIRGERFELLCEYQGKDGLFQSVFVKDAGNDVIIEKGKGAAISGLFSLEGHNVKQLFDYIEATLSGDDGLVCWHSLDMIKHMERAQESGGKYPLLLKSMGEIKRLPLLYRQGALDSGLIKEIEAHTFPVEHTVEVEQVDDEVVFYPDSEEEFSEPPKITPAALLPDGWTWVEYFDGSGHLEGPGGVRVFGYDRLTVPGGVEYERDGTSGWSNFWGSFADFKKEAEQSVRACMIEDIGGHKDMISLEFYFIENLKENFECVYCKDIVSALEQFQEALQIKGARPALGVRVIEGSAEMGALDLLHGFNGDAVLVPDYRDLSNCSKAMQAAEQDLREAVRWLIEEKWCVKYEYQNDLLPVWAQGGVSVLVPITLGNEQKSSYCEGKVLKAEFSSGVDAIDSLYIEYHGWVAYNELLKHPDEYVSDGAIVVPQLNVAYVLENHVVGIDGRMDIAPHDFAAMVNQINKPYALVVYDGQDYTMQYRGKHEFIVASYDDVASAVQGWYEVQERLQGRRYIPMLVQSYVPGEARVVFNGFDENSQRMSYQQAVEKFGLPEQKGLDSVIGQAAREANERNAADKSSIGKETGKPEHELN